MRAEAAICSRRFSHANSLLNSECFEKDRAFPDNATVNPVLLLLLGSVVLLRSESGHTAESGPQVLNSNLPPYQLTLSGNSFGLFRDYFDLYVIEATTNLVDWQPLVRLLHTNSTAPLVFADTNAARLSHRYAHFITAFPEPSGPFSVGTFSRLVTDPSRSNRYDIPTNCSFMVSFWYPSVANSGAFPSAYMDAKLAEDPGCMCESGNVDPRVVRRLVAHAVPQAQIVPGDQRFPVIVYSHGYHGHRKLNTHTVEELASHGFIVVALDHCDCVGTVFPDGRYLKGIEASGDSFAALIPDRIRDTQVVLEELSRMNATDSLLARRLDLGRIGAFGMSLGVADTAELGRIDDRVKCFALMDGSVLFSSHPNLAKSGLQKPFLIMKSPTTDEDTESPVLFKKAIHDAVWLYIEGANHLTFVDAPWVVQPTFQSRRAAETITACLLSFFSKYLKGQDDHLLDDPSPAYPEVIRFMRK
jgi:dienelactone hydrolase